MPNETYQKNLDFLQKLYPVFAEKLRETPIASNYELEIAKTGNNTLKYEGILFHSRMDPVRECERVLEKEDYSEKDLIIQAGLGLGYTALALFHKYPGRPLLLVEKNWEIVKLALQSNDFTPLFQSGLVELIVPEDPAYLIDYLKPYSCSKLAIVFHRPSFESFPDYYKQVREVVQNFISTKQVNIATINRFEKLWFKNMILNMSSYLYHNGVQELFGKFAQMPALLIGAGPSLVKQIPLIQQNKNKMLLFAVNTSLSYLLEHDIIPDFVVAVDPQDKVFRYFLPLLRRKLPYYPILIAEPTISPKIVKNYPGPVLFCNVGVLENWVQEFAPPKGELLMGGSVITAAYSLARMIKSSPVILVGVDMAYSEKTVHFRGAELEKEWLYTQNTLNTQEELQYNFVRKLEMIPTEGYNGETVFTDIKFLTFINWLEKNFAAYPEPHVINCTEGGAKLKYCTQQDFKTTLQSLPLISHKKLETLNFLAPTYALNKEKFLNIIAGMEKNIPVSSHEIRKALKISREIYSLIEQNKPIAQSKINFLDQVDNTLIQNQFNPVLSLSIQKIIYQINEALEDKLDAKEKNNPRLKTMRYSIMLYEAIQESMEFTLAQLAKAKKYQHNLEQKIALNK